MSYEIVCTRGPMKGKAILEGEGEWQTVTDENKADMRFFKVEVALP